MLEILINASALSKNSAEDHFFKFVGKGGSATVGIINIPSSWNAKDTIDIKSMLQNYGRSKRMSHQTSAMAERA